MSKTALCIGINNYPGTDLDLAGCVNDAHDWAALLGEHGYVVTRLVDAQASKAGLVAAFGKIIGAARSGDTVVITFSGHGTYVTDTNGDEADGFDEALCPYDVQLAAGPLIDDEIHALFKERRAGARLVLISDSCHSGTVTRALGPDPDAADLPRPRFMPMANWSRGAAAVAAAKAGAAAPKAGGSPFKKVLAEEDDLLLAGCREGPLNASYDAVFGKRPNGAFSHHAIKALRALLAKRPDASYADWHAAITPALLPSADCPQEPQLVGGAAARAARVFA